MPDLPERCFKAAHCGTQSQTAGERMKITRSIPERRTVDRIVFDSILEAEHYCGLKLLQSRGVIRSLQIEPEFRFVVNGILVGKFKPDFVYIVVATNATRVEDVKGWKKSAKTGKLLPRVDKGFRLRANLMKACFGLEVEIV